MIWHRNEIASMRRPSPSRIRTRKLRIGISVSGSAPAETTSRSRSGTDMNLHARSAAEFGEERIDPLPYLLSATEPPPADPNESYELEATVDGCDVVVAGSAHTIDQQGLHVGLERPQQVVLRDQAAPSLEGQH